MCIGVRHFWKRLLDGQSGIVSLQERGDQFASLPSRIAGLIPRGTKEDGGWSAKEQLAPGVSIHVIVKVLVFTYDIGWAPDGTVCPIRNDRFSWSATGCWVVTKWSFGFGSYCNDLKLILYHRKVITGIQGVYLGSGIGSLDDVYETSVAYSKGVSVWTIFEPCMQC